MLMNEADQRNYLHVFQLMNIQKILNKILCHTAYSIANLTFLGTTFPKLQIFFCERNRMFPA